MIHYTVTSSHCSHTPKDKTEGNHFGRPEKLVLYLFEVGVCFYLLAVSTHKQGHAYIVPLSFKKHRGKERKRGKKEEEKKKRQEK